MRSKHCISQAVKATNLCRSAMHRFIFSAASSSSGRAEPPATASSASSRAYPPAGPPSNRQRALQAKGGKGRGKGWKRRTRRRTAPTTVFEETRSITSTAPTSPSSPIELSSDTSTLSDTEYGGSDTEGAIANIVAPDPSSRKPNRRQRYILHGSNTNEMGAPRTAAGVRIRPTPTESPLASHPEDSAEQPVDSSASHHDGSLEQPADIHLSWRQFMDMIDTWRFCPLPREGSPQPMKVLNGPST